MDHLPSPPSADEVFADLLSALYDGPTEASPWRGFAERLRQALNAGNVAITLHHRHGHLGDAYVMAADAGDATDWDAVEAHYRERFLQLDPIRPDLMTPGEVVVIEAAGMEPAWREFLDSLDIASALRTCFTEPGGMRCWIDIVRRRWQPPQPFSTTDVQLVRRLLPHLARALKLYVALKQQEINNAIHEGTIAHLGLGCVLLNGEGAVIHVSRAAAALIERTPEIHCAHGRLQLADRAAQRGFDAAVAAVAAARARADETHCGTLVRVRTRQDRLLGLLVQPAPLLHYYQCAPAPCAIIHLADLNQNVEALQPSRENSRALIAQLFGLTRQEAKLALLLTGGHTIAEAAAEMNIAETAARNYSKRVYAKVGIRSQTELVRLVYRSLVFLR